MIAMIQVLEAGNDYTVYTVKGAELQETTVCHAEENENINEITKEIFEKKVCCDPHFAFSLSPIKQVDFNIYEDLKFQLAGIIENPDFGKMVKTYFMRVLAYKVSGMISAKKPVFKMMIGKLSD